MKKVVWTRPATKDLKLMDREKALLVKEAINRFAVFGQGDVRKLKGFKNEFRLRVGDSRVRFILDAQKHTIVVLRVLPRNKAY